jgi:hypothetical protein
MQEDGTDSPFEVGIRLAFVASHSKDSQPSGELIAKD